MISALDFHSGGWWFELGRCRRVASSNKKFYSTLSLFAQVYKWVPAIIMLGGGGGGVTLRWTSIPSRGVATCNIPSRFMLQKPELSASLLGHLARMKTYLTYL